MVVVKLKDNVQLYLGQVAIEISIILVMALMEYNKLSMPRNTLISETCSDYVSLDDD